MWQKIKNGIAKFMYGRYGADNLYRGLLLLYAILLILQIFLNSKIISVLIVLVFIWMIFRVLSKNHVARAKENQIYLKLMAPIKRYFSLLGAKFKDRKTKRYRTCPHCRATMRLPIKKGRHTVRCRKCGKEFKVTILW